MNVTQYSETVNPPWGGGTVDTTRLSRTTMSKEQTTNDCIMMGTDNKAYRVRSSQVRYRVTQEAFCCFNSLPTTLPRESQLTGYSAAALPYAINHAKLSEWTPYSYRIIFDPTTRVYRFDLTLIAVSEYVKKLSTETREELPMAKGDYSNVAEE